MDLELILNPTSVTFKEQSQIIRTKIAIPKVVYKYSMAYDTQWQIAKEQHQFNLNLGQDSHLEEQTAQNGGWR